MNLNETLAERQGQHGNFSDNAHYAQQFKAIARTAPNWDIWSDVQREAMDNILQKAARALSGDPFYTDSWHDIAGYAHLAEKDINERTTHHSGKDQSISAGHFETSSDNTTFRPEAVEELHADSSI